ncbi:MAG: hypothetical protein ACI9EF_000310 [Pseudohongiellaceae bacterium]|jgi:hypothetical protein
MKRIFIVGCPRSGSTWTTFLLSKHAEVATFQHAKIFDYLVGMKRWHHNKAGFSFIVNPSGDPTAQSSKEDNVKLAEVLPEASLWDLLRHVAAGIIDSVATVRPGVTAVVDKTPENGHLAPFILKVLPDAYFLHIVRDPRSTFCSHRSASRGWAKWEFPTQPIDGARYWRHDVEAALAIKEMTPRYLQVRYEDLKDKGASELQRMYEWIGLESDLDFCESAMAASTKDKVRGATGMAKEFVRKTPKGGWRDELSASHTRIIEHLAGELLEQLGYDRTQPRWNSTPLRIALADLPVPLLHGLEKKLHRLTQLMHWRWVGRKLEWPEP